MLYASTKDSDQQKRRAMVQLKKEAKRQQSVDSLTNWWGETEVRKLWQDSRERDKTTRNEREVRILVGSRGCNLVRAMLFARENIWKRCFTWSLHTLRKRKWPVENHSYPLLFILHVPLCNLLRVCVCVWMCSYLKVQSVLLALCTTYPTLV